MPPTSPVAETSPATSVVAMSGLSKNHTASANSISAPVEVVPISLKSVATGIIPLSTTMVAIAGSTATDTTSGLTNDPVEPPLDCPAVAPEPAVPVEPLAPCPPEPVASSEQLSAVRLAATPVSTRRKD